MQAGDHANQLLIAEGHDDATADGRTVIVLELVGKGPIERYRQHHITKNRHQREGTDNPSSAMASFKSCHASFFWSWIPQQVGRVIGNDELGVPALVHAPAQAAERRLHAQQVGRGG